MIRRSSVFVTKRSTRLCVPSVVKTGVASMARSSSSIRVMRNPTTAFVSDGKRNSAASSAERNSYISAATGVPSLCAFPLFVESSPHWRNSMRSSAMLRAFQRISPGLRARCMWNWSKRHGS